MPVVRPRGLAFVWFASMIAACKSSSPSCPEATLLIEVPDIPEGQSGTTVAVEIDNPFPDNGLQVVTELSAESGTFDDRFARETTYACVHDVSGPVEICVRATFGNGDDGAPGTDEQSILENVDFGLGLAGDYLRGPHATISDPSACGEVRCTTITCPERKNECPFITSVTAEPMTIDEGGSSTITVIAEDPDANPEPLVSELTTSQGMLGDPSALSTTYTCNPNVGGVVEICALVSDGDAACDVEECTGVLCPGEPPENTCPIIETFTAGDTSIPPGETATTVRVHAMDLDRFPEPLRTELRSETGVFDDRFAQETTFTCGEPGPVDICVDASDGDRACDQTRCLTLQCPSNIPANLCPSLFVINAVPSTVPRGETTTLVQTRAQDIDRLPLALTLTLRALWGRFQNDENMIGQSNVVFQDATYICERPGDVEICVDATDGACVKTLCTVVECPADVSAPL